MKVIISERQYKSISEQGGFTPMGNPYTKEGQKGIEIFSKTIDPHTAMTILQIVTAFLPLVGFYLSASIGLMDAKLHWDKGEKEKAGLIALFSILPNIDIAGKLGLKKWSSNTLIEIAKKIGIGSKLNQVEQQVVNRIAQYKKLIETELSKLGKEGTIQVAKEIAKNRIVRNTVINKVSKTAANTTVRTLAKNIVPECFKQNKIDINKFPKCVALSSEVMDGKIPNPSALHACISEVTSNSKEIGTKTSALGQCIKSKLV